MGNYKSRGGIIYKKCLTCGKDIRVKKSKDKHNSGKFCSRRCYGKNRSERRTGANNPCWRGGKTEKIDLIRESKKYAEWRQNVFIRDGFTCKCGHRGGDIHAHHIIQFSKIIKEIKENLPLYDIYDAAMIYPPLWDISNGQTMCKSCHIKIHKKKGIAQKPCTNKNTVV